MSVFKRLVAGAVVGSAALACLAGSTPAAARAWVSVDVAPAYYPPPAPVYAYPQPYIYAPPPGYWFWHHREHRVWLDPYRDWRGHRR